MQHIAILDFGSQYTHLIARRIREFNVRSDIYPADTKIKDLPKETIGIILSGGPQSVYAPNSVRIDPALFDLGKPILGLCYGHQLLAKTLGGEVAAGKIREYGRAKLKILNDDRLTAGISNTTTVWMSHGDAVVKLPEGFKVSAATTDCPIAAMANVQQNFYGLQFHPEVRHTAEGGTILKNFVLDICGAKQDWQIENAIASIEDKIRRQVNAKKVFLLVSGGVDSSVCFALLSKALGKDKVYGLYIDTGFMRQGESNQIKQSLEAAGFSNLHILDASRTFYKKLANVIDPEEKRKIIGQTFLDVKDEAAKNLGLSDDEWVLAQGTIYPDTIESGGTKHADTIKTHHNRVAAIQKLISEGKVVEPLADFYKDEVRAIGRRLGLPDELIKRHPFPGPGLAIRILCSLPPSRGEPEGGSKSEVNKQKRKSPPLKPSPNPSLQPEAPRTPLAVDAVEGRGISIALLPIQSVGVQGDNRTYAHPLAIIPPSPLLPDLSAEVRLGRTKAEEGTKGWWEWEELDEIASHVTNTRREINRVLLLLNPQKAEDFDLAPDKRSLSENRIKLLQKIDKLVMDEIVKAGLYDKIWQFPVVLIPLGHKRHESIVLRPVVSEEAMTAHFARLPAYLLSSLTEKILVAGGIDYVFYDITNKPPGTIEWE